MANNGGYRDEREAMAARNEELQRENAALGQQASQLGLVQRENAELRRRLGEPGARPPRSRSTFAVVGALVAVFVLACVAGLLMFSVRHTSQSASMPTSYAPQPVAVPAPAPAPAVPVVPSVEPQTR